MIQAKFMPNPKFGDGLPSVPSNLRPAFSTPYIRKRYLDVSKRYTRSRLELDQAVVKYNDLIASLTVAFDGLLTDYDRKIVMPTTCAMGLWKPSHTDVDELTQQVYPNDFTYDAELIRVVASDIKTRYAESTDVMSLPRGKSIGYPWAVPGSNRRLADIFLILSAAIAVGAKRKGMSLQDLLTDLSKFHGPAFDIWAARSQMTDKLMPVITDTLTTWSQNFEPRVRGIFMSPKLVVAYNRSVVKGLTKAIIQSHLHSQDRADIQRRMNRFNSDGWLVLSMDYSKYERHVGGARAASIFEVLGQVVGEKANAGLKTEFDIPILMFGRKGPYILDGGQILASGLSTTSVIGNIGNDLTTCTALGLVMNMSPADVYRRVSSPSGDPQLQCLLFGDDSILAFHPSLVKDLGGRSALVTKLKDAYAVTKMTVDEEPAVKYLGHVYAKGQFTGSYDVGYPTWRGVQQQFFPERSKEYPFSAIGYIARLDMLGKRAIPFHATVLKFWDEKLMGPKFDYESRFTVLKTLIPLVEKHSQNISQLDDILQSVYHGLAEYDIPDDSEFKNLFGLTQLKIADPIAQLKDLNLSEQSLEGISEWLSGNLSRYDVTLSHLVQELGLQWKRHDLLY